jgi:hypothetical protein
MEENEAAPPRGGLIPHARKGWRLWSVRLNAIGLAIQSVFMAWVSLPLDLWNMMPGELKAFLPPRAMFILPALFFAAAMAARFVRQPKLDREKCDDVD